MPSNLIHLLISGHLAGGAMVAGEEIGLIADQVLLQDVLGSLVETDNLNAEEHLFLRSACQRSGIWYSRPGIGISHPTHMQRFGKPGSLLIGCDSHRSAAGSLGMFAVGAGGMDVAMALIGEPFYLQMPEVWGVHVTGRLSEWASAKDVALEMLRRHGVEGGSGRVVEYYGPGLDQLSVMDRHVIANLGAELGVTTTVFPSDGRTREFLTKVGREMDWIELHSEDGAADDHHDEIDLSRFEPMIATPSSPGNVVRVRDLSKVEIFQSYIGSSANPGYRDFAIAAKIVEGKATHDRVSFDINPSTRQVLEQLVSDGHMAMLVKAGARVHQAGCNGCIGMGRPSLRTVPRNFRGRSGTREDSVYLCSPETAAASALVGVITDPRDLGLAYPKIEEPLTDLTRLRLVPPLPDDQARAIRLEKTDSIVSLPDLPKFGEDSEATVLIKVGDDISTDAITPAGTQVLPLWANIPKVAEFTFRDIDTADPERAKQLKDRGEFHAIIAGRNYGQGSSRENSALAPRYLGLGIVVAKSFARIHWQNLINFGVLPLTFADEDGGKLCKKLDDYEIIAAGEKVILENLSCVSASNKDIELKLGSGGTLRLRHNLSNRQIEVLRAGGLNHPN